MSHVLGMYKNLLFNKYSNKGVALIQGARIYGIVLMSSVELPASNISPPLKRCFPLVDKCRICFKTVVIRVTIVVTIQQLAL